MGAVIVLEDGTGGIYKGGAKDARGYCFGGWYYNCSI